MSRMDDLLVSTARELIVGNTPLNGAWLVDNDVSFDEAMDLADSLAMAIHVYRATIKLGLRLAANDTKDTRTLQALVVDMAIRQGGPSAILAEAMRLEEAAS